MDFDGKTYAGSLPTTPGVYRMYAHDGVLLYVGKAKNLRRRVGSYFSKTLTDPRLVSMLNQIQRMDVSLTRTEAEALVLESQLIKAQRPRYNIQLREGAGYPHLRLTLDQPFPRLFVHRGKPAAGCRDFGPFPNTEAVRASMALMQKTFRLRNCSEVYFRHRSRPCLQHGIGRCSAPCVGYVSESAYAEQVSHAIAFLEGRSHEVIGTLVEQMDQASTRQDFELAARLRDRIANLRAIQSRMDVRINAPDRDVWVALRREATLVITRLTYRQGQSLGSESFFPDDPLGSSDLETLLSQFVLQHYLAHPAPRDLVLSPSPTEAAPWRMGLESQAGHPVTVHAHPSGERAQQVALAERNAEVALNSHLASRTERQRRLQGLVDLLGLPSVPQRLECFDISHTRGEQPVASCVVFGPDGPMTSAYRRYNIEGVAPGDDYAAMRQALERRFKRVISGERPAPDVLFVDGGRGQLAQAMEVIERVDVALRPRQVVGVSKGPGRRAGEETLWRSGLPPLHPGPLSPGLHLIQHVRDESHRFAITGHRRRRQAARSRSSLESIPGLGPRRREALLKAFGGWQGVSAVGPEELARLPGISQVLAQRIYDHIHGSVQAASDEP